MSDTDESTQPDAPEGQPAAPPAGAAPATPPAPEGQANHDDADDPRIAALSREAASYRRRLRELEQQEEERQRAALSETDRLKAEAADAKRRLAEVEADRNRERAQARIVAAAAKANAHDPDTVWALVRDDAIAAGDELDADALVKAAVKAKPFLVRTPGSGSAADPAKSHGGPREETHADRMRRIRGESPASFLFDPNAARQRGGGVIYRGTD